MKHELLAKLTTATLRGAALAALTLGCESTVVDTTDDDGDGLDSDGLDSDGLGCFGKNYQPPGDFPGFHGQCCIELLCYTPEEGQCAAPDSREVGDLPGYPLGSGSCRCGGDVEGPFEGDPATDGGTCCYKVGSIGCDGRPFLIAGEARVALVRRRNDWL